MAVNVYRSDDPGAPVVSGTAGTFITLLDACLVNGYGSKAAAGWTKPFSGTNLAAYRQGGGRQMYLAVDHTVAQYPTLRGFKTMTDVSNGTNAFPSTVLLAGGIRPLLSAAASTTARPWIIVATNKAFYFWVAANSTDMSTLNTSVDITFFGDYVSYVTNDAWNTAIIGKEAANTTATSTRFGCNLVTAPNTMSTGHYIVSSYLQDGNATQFGAGGSILSNSAHMGAAGVTFPDPISGSLVLDRVRILESGPILRGHLPGLYNPIHAVPGNHLDTFTGTGALAGKTFLLLYKGGTAGRIVLSLDEADW